MRKNIYENRNITDPNYNLKMVVSAVDPLKQIASFLKLQSGKITYKENTLPTRVVNKKQSTGYINIILDLLQEANSDLLGQNELENVEIRQWLEYTIAYVIQCESATQVLQELNIILATRTYLVSYRLTVGDLFLYYVLYPIMENLTVLEKEKFVHVSRWFDNLQQNPSIRQSNKILNFNTLYLTNIAPARH